VPRSCAARADGGMATPAVRPRRIPDAAGLGYCPRPRHNIKSERARLGLLSPRVPGSEREPAIPRMSELADCANSWRSRTASDGWGHFAPARLSPADSAPRVPAGGGVPVLSLATGRRWVGPAAHRPRGRVDLARIQRGWRGPLRWPAAAEVEADGSTDADEVLVGDPTAPGSDAARRDPSRHWPLRAGAPRMMLRTGVRERERGAVKCVDAR
jgi:hypothetical protein